MRHYIGLIHKDEVSDYGVSFPDFPGVIAVGGTLDEVQALAAEALAFHVEGMMEDEAPLPAPSSLQGVMDTRENRDGVAILVPLKAAPDATGLVEVAVPEGVLARIDAYAGAHGLTRSGFLLSAAQRVIDADAA